MTMNKLCGSTLDRAEIIVDYEKNKSEIIGVPEDSLKNRLSSAAVMWFNRILILFMIVVGTIYLFGGKDLADELSLTILKIISAIYIFLISLHLNKNFDKIVRKKFTRDTGNIKRNKISISGLKSKQFVIYDFSNTILDFKAKGDFSKQLKKIWIKEEHPSSIEQSQANIKSMAYLKNENVWNAYFYFKDVPRDGELYIEWA